MNNMDTQSISVAVTTKPPLKYHKVSISNSSNGFKFTYKGTHTLPTKVGFRKPESASGSHPRKFSVTKDLSEKLTKPIAPVTQASRRTLIDLTYKQETPPILEQYPFPIPRVVHPVLSRKPLRPLLSKDNLLIINAHPIQPKETLTTPRIDAYLWKELPPIQRTATLVSADKPKPLSYRNQIRQAKELQRQQAVLKKEQAEQAKGIYTTVQVSQQVFIDLTTPVSADKPQPLTHRNQKRKANELKREKALLKKSRIEQVQKEHAEQLALEKEQSALRKQQSLTNKLIKLKDEVNSLETEKTSLLRRSSRIAQKQRKNKISLSDKTTNLPKLKFRPKILKKTRSKVSKITSPQSTSVNSNLSVSSGKLPLKMRYKAGLLNVSRN